MGVSGTSAMQFMTLRVFLRGGYQRLTGPTMVVKRGLPLFTVMPHGQGYAIDTRVEHAYERRSGS